MGRDRNVFKCKGIFISEQYYQFFKNLNGFQKFIKSENVSVNRKGFIVFDDEQSWMDRKIGRCCGFKYYTESHITYDANEKCVLIPCIWPEQTLYNGGHEDIVIKIQNTPICGYINHIYYGYGFMISLNNLENQEYQHLLSLRDEGKINMCINCNPNLECGTLLFVYDNKDVEHIKNYVGYPNNKFNENGIFTQKINKTLYAGAKKSIAIATIYYDYEKDLDIYQQLMQKINIPKIKLDCFDEWIFTYFEIAPKCETIQDESGPNKEEIENFYKNMNFSEEIINELKKYKDTYAEYIFSYDC